MLEIQYSKDLIEEEKAKAEAEAEKETEKKEATTGVETDEAETTSNDANNVEDSVEAEDEENPADEEVQEERTLKGFGQELQIPEFLLRGEREDTNAKASRAFATPSRRNSKQSRCERLVKVEKKQSTEAEAETTSEQETLKTTKGKVDTASDFASKTRKNNAEDGVYYHTSTDSEVYRKKKKKNLSDILKVASAIGVFAIVVLIIMQANKLYSSRLQTDSDDNLYRNLDNKVSQLPEEPTGRTTSWDNELSGFVEDDFAKLKKNRVTLSYEYGSEKLFFEYESGKIKMYNTGVEDIYNCSIYKKNKSIVVYGTTSDDSFLRLEFSKLQAGYNVLGNYNIPLNIETTTVTKLINGYYLCIDENKVFVCKDKKVVTTANYNIKSKVNRVINTNIGGYYSEYPLIYTEDKSLYLPIVITNGEENVKVELKPLISEIDIPDSVSHFDCIDVDDYWLSIPMFENGSESMLFIPKNMDVYSEYFYNETPMEKDSETDWEAVPLKQQIIKATINCRDDEYLTKNDWYVRLYINVADKIATYEYKLDGIDTNTEVPDAEKESYNCYSEDEYWNAVEEIRKLYSEYYSQRP